MCANFFMINLDAIMLLCYNFSTITEKPGKTCYKIKPFRHCEIQDTKKNGQVDFPELPETPEITEMTENFTKVTKYLTKFKETLINYVWEKSHVKKQ